MAAFILFIGIIAFGAYQKFYGQRYTNPTGLPAGVIDRYESKDKTLILTLYKERIQIISPSLIQAGNSSKSMDILVSDLEGVDKRGNKVTLYTKDHTELGFDFSVIDPLKAQKFKEQVEMLMSRLPVNARLANP
jgi:hypothetical protein